MRRGMLRGDQKKGGIIETLPESHTPSDLVHDLTHTHLPAEESRRGRDKIFDNFFDQTMHDGERGMKVHVHLRLLEERERTQIVADQFRQLRIDQRDDLSRVQRATNGATEFIEHIEFSGPFLKMVALDLEQALLLAELLIGFLQLLIRFLQIA